MYTDAQGPAGPGSAEPSKPTHDPSPRRPSPGRAGVRRHRRSKKVLLGAAAASVSGILATATAADAPTGLAPLPSQLAVGDGKALKEARSPARAEWIRSHYVKHEYRIPMRDGVFLFTSVYMPMDASPKNKYPILLNRTPYSVAPYGTSRYKDRIGPFEDYEREGFIFVFQDVRGRHLSEGEFINMRPHIDSKRSPRDIDESSDTHDTIEWLLRHVSGHNGRVGMWGISYPGFYASAGAIDSHPALKAISPQAPIADWFRGDDMHRHGAFNLEMAFDFFSVFGLKRSRPTDDEKWEPFDFGTVDRYRYFLELGPLSQALSRFSGPVPFWEDIVAHPNYDSFWQTRNIVPHLRGVRAASLVVGGWYDMEDLYGPLSTYAQLRAQNPGTPSTLLIGPWIHGGWSRTDGAGLGDSDFGFKTSETYRSVELAFFKQHLKGGPDASLPAAYVFETGANRWRSFDAWPPRGTTSRSLYMSAAAGLAYSPPSAAAPPPSSTPDPGYDEYVSDPSHPVPCSADGFSGCGRRSVAADQRFAAARPDVLTYRTPVLDRDLTLAGPVEAELWMSTSGSDADYVVKLIDENPARLPGQGKDPLPHGEPDRGGQQTLVRVEPFRARFRNGYSQPKPMQPGQPTRIRFVLNDVFHTFQRRHRLVVQVQSSLFPFIDRNPQRFVPNLFHAQASDYTVAAHRLHRTSSQPSRITVRMLPAVDEPAEPPR